MKKLIEIVRWWQVNSLTILLICFMLFIFYAFSCFLNRDISAKESFSWNIFQNVDKSIDNFYSSYEKEFVKQTSQEIINEGLRKWVDAKMNKLGYIKYNDFFYLNGEKKYYDELPLCCK